jgi:hypothetical protein
MEWLHIPIKDGGVPEDEAERIWAEVGPRIRGLLQEGQRVLFHCRAGHGRSGMMAARLLVELGWSAERSITEVRRVRPGAIERGAQEAAVRGWGSVTTMTKSQETYENFNLNPLKVAPTGRSLETSCPGLRRPQSSGQAAGPPNAGRMVSTAPTVLAQMPRERLGPRGQGRPELHREAVSA